MQKALLTAGVIILLAAFIIYQKVGNTSPVDTGSLTAPDSATGVVEPTVPSTTGTGDGTGTTAATGATGTQTAGTLKDGSYTGAVADAFYGNLQVKAVVSGGKLTDVTFLQYPNDRQESIQVSNMSMPILKSEAIKAQSANVDVVSGATQTSEAFVQTLGSALQQAQA